MMYDKCCLAVLLLLGLGQASIGANIVAPALKTEILSSRYCEGDDEVGTLQVLALLVYTNVNIESLIIYKSKQIVRLMLAHNREDLNARRFDFDLEITNVNAGVQEVSDDRPGRAYAILGQNRSFETKAMITNSFQTFGDQSECASTR